MSWRQRQTAILTQVLLLTIAALFSHLGWVAQPWVTGGRKSLGLQAGSHYGILSPTDSNRLGTWLYYCLTSTCFRCSFAYLHRCISWLTARSRVNIWRNDHLLAWWNQYITQARESPSLFFLDSKLALTYVFGRLSKQHVMSTSVYVLPWNIPDSSSNWIGTIRSKQTFYCT